MQRGAKEKTMPTRGPDASASKRGRWAAGRRWTSCWAVRVEKEGGVKKGKFFFFSFSNLLYSNLFKLKFQIKLFQTLSNYFINL
jgi:hypothetical protein